MRTRGAVNRFLDVVERIGNALPDPTTLFALLALAAQFDLALAAGLLIVVPLSVTSYHLVVANKIAMRSYELGQ